MSPDGPQFHLFFVLCRSVLGAKLPRRSALQRIQEPRLMMVVCKSLKLGELYMAGKAWCGAYRPYVDSVPIRLGS
ncbi:hypothetical protein EDB19DRAFT_1774882 [Suillus lakei]|nr:hypothetical protein EDB19DRAFT_1774882 [Suillus lakei]